MHGRHQPRVRLDCRIVTRHQSEPYRPVFGIEIERVDVSCVGAIEAGRKSTQTGKPHIHPGHSSSIRLDARLMLSEKSFTADSSPRRISSIADPADSR